MAPPKSTAKRKAAKKTAPKRLSRKKAARRKKGVKRRSSNRNAYVKDQLFRSFAGICLLICLVATAGVIFHYLLPPDRNERPYNSENIRPSEGRGRAKKHATAEAAKDRGKEQSTQETAKGQTAVGKPETTVALAPGELPKYEIFPEKDFAPAEKTKKSSNDIAPVKLPKVAIIIDDLGYDPHMAEKFLEIDADFTFSVIPNSPFHEKVAKMVRLKGGELMLHLPMEPKEYPDADPGEGALMAEMSPDELIEQLKKNIALVPGIKGVNGHMGLKLTEDSARMNQVFSILKRENLYFVDSFTSPDSVCLPSARMLKVPFARRDVFIDHYQDAGFIRRQLRLLVKLAKEHGEAVGIVHPHMKTIEVLEAEVPEMRKKVELIPASKLVRILG